MTDVPHLPPTPPGQVSRKQLIIPGFLAVALLAGIGVVLVLAQRSGDTGAPPQPPPYATPAAERPVIVLSVQQIDDGQPVFASTDGSGTVDYAIPGSATVEVLERATLGDLQPGDWLMASGVPNRVRNFAIRDLVAIPGPFDVVGGEFVRTPAGFLGHEAGDDSDAAPVLGGVVTEASAAAVVINTGHDLVEVTPGEFEPVPLRVAREGSTDDLVPGARVAIPVVGGAPDPSADAILVALP